MFKPAACTPPSGPSQTQVSEFTKSLEEHIGQLIPEGFKAFGDAVQDAVGKMVPPMAKANYDAPASVVSLAAFEASNIGQKIVRYQYIERYKFFAKMPDAEMGMAFTEHMYSVRNAELYNVLERGEALIRFAASVALDLGVGDAKAPNRYAKSYRSKFEYRLRERHRLTHGHERPSLVSRMLQLGEPQTDGE